MTILRTLRIVLGLVLVIGTSWQSLPAVADELALIADEALTPTKTPSRDLALPDELVDTVYPFYRLEGVTQQEAEALFGSAVAAIWYPDRSEVQMLSVDGLETARLWLSRRVEEADGKLALAFRPPGEGIETKVVETAGMTLRSFADAAQEASKACRPTGNEQYLVKIPSFTPSSQAPGEAPGRLPVNGNLKGSWYIYQDFEGDVWQYWTRSDNTGGQYTWGVRSCDSHYGAYSADAARGGSLGASLSCTASYPNNVRLYMYSEACEIVEPQWKGFLELQFKASIATDGNDYFSVQAEDASGGLWGWRFWGNWSSWYTLLFNLRQWYYVGDLANFDCNTLYLGLDSDSISGSGWGARVDDLYIWYGDTVGSYECGIDADPETGAAPLTVAFRALTDIYGASFRWYFDDGTTSEVRDPAHRFSTPGDYYVELQVTDSYGTYCYSSQKVRVTQGSCTYQITPTSASYNHTGGTGTVSVDASSSNCPWTASSNASWVSITSGTSGTGDGTVSYTVASNGSSSSRTGTLTIAGRTFTATQSGAPSCTPPTITTQPSSQTIASGATASLSVAATGTTPFTYQWYRGQSGDSSSPVAGATAANYMTPPLTQTTSYWVRVSNSCGQADSVTATISVPACIPPTITTHPASQTVQSGSTATLTVAATGTMPLSYQWYRGQSGIVFDPIVGATSATLTTPALTSTTSYWVEVSNSCGSVYSNTATVTVTTEPASYVYWVPAVIHAAGAQGSQWRADVGMLNRGASTAALGLTLYTETQSLVAGVSVGNGRQGLYPDIVVQLFGISGSGLLRIESTQPLTVAARVYNQAVSGTFGQGIDGFTTADTLSAGDEVYLPLLAQSSAFRTNIGFSNTSTSSATVNVTLHLGDGTVLGSFDVEVSAGSWKQENEPYRVRYGRTDVTNGFAVVRVVTGTGLSTYGSVVDNLTGDPTTIVMRR